MITYILSAGIGRTGTYIAIDVLSEAGKKHNKISIAEYVRKMRRNRMNMVQTYVNMRIIQKKTLYILNGILELKLVLKIKQYNL